MKTLAPVGNMYAADILYFDKNPKVENVVKYLRQHFEEHFSEYLLNFDKVTISFERRKDYDLIIVDDESKSQFLLELKTIIPIF